MKKINRLMPKVLNEKPKSSAWQPKLSTAIGIRERYGDAESFLITFNPSLQLLVSTHVEQAYLGTAPTLGEVKTCYGEATAIAWMCAMLEDLNDFVGARQKMELPQQISLSKLVLAVYHYLKVTELQLFFHRLKCGRYGRFFGSVDTLFLTESLLAFIHERGQELHHFVTERREQEQEASRQQAGPCVTYQEYLELKRLKNETT